MQEKAYNSKMMLDTAFDKCTAPSKASSHFFSEEYRQSFSFLIKRRGLSSSPTWWWTSCWVISLAPTAFPSACLSNPDAMTNMCVRHWLLPVGIYRNSKDVQKCWIRRLRCCISCEPLELESPNLTGSSRLSCSTFAPDMTSLTTSGRKLQWESRWKCRLRRLQVVNFFRTV